MVSITELKGDSYLPEGISREVALKIAAEMREILNMDLDEVEIAVRVILFDSVTDREYMLGAWGYLTAPERRSWKAFLKYDEWYKLEKLRGCD